MPAGDSSAAPTPAAEEFLTEMQLQEAVVPARNLRVLAEELRGTGPIPEVVNETAPTYRLNESQRFWINNDDSNEHFQIDAHAWPTPTMCRTCGSKRARPMTRLT